MTGRIIRGPWEREEGDPGPGPADYPDMADAAGEGEGTARQQAAAPLRVRDSDAFADMPLPPRRLLLAPWLPQPGLAMLYAPRGVGKTHLALRIAHAVATGGALLGWDAPEPKRVLFVDGEMPAVALQERLRAMRDVAGRAGGWLSILSADDQEGGVPDLAQAAGQRALEPVIGDASLIVLDNLSTLLRSGVENEAESWAGFQTWLLGQRRAGRSVLMVHHAGKGGDQRGTSKREDVLDTVIRLDRPDGYTAAQGARFNVSFTKARGFHGADAEPFEASLCDGAWSRQPIAAGIASAAQALRDGGHSQRAIADLLGTSAATVNRALRGQRDGE